MKILSVEPDPSYADAICQQLEGSGIGCIATTASGLTAVTGALESSRPDLVVLGIGLPTEARRAIRDLIRQRKPRIPLIMLSARTSTGPVMDSADDHVFTTDLPGLPMAVRCALMNRRAHRQPAVDERGRGQLVFVVDDNDDIRESIRIGLTSHGYRTLSLRDGVEAVAQYASRIQEVVLVITDLDMPRLGGQALAKTLRHLNPTLRILFISGTGTDERLEAAADLPGTEYLPKPFRLKELIAKVESLLHAPDVPQHQVGYSPHCPRG